MSSKSTIFGLNGLEHWYEEGVDPRDTIAIEVTDEALADYYPGDGLTVWIKKDSQLGKLLTHPDVKAVLERVAEEQNAAEAERYRLMLP